MEKPLVRPLTATGDKTENNNAFEFFDSRDIEIKDFTFTTDNHVNCAGRIIATDVENTTYYVKIDDAFPMTGWEHLWGSNTCDEEGTPNYHLDTYDKITRENIALENGEERLKISGVRYKLLENSWAEEGDVLIVYDRDTLIEKGRITVKSYEDGFVVIADHTGEYGVGDVLANDAYFASVELENCEVRDTRARGFLLQSRNVTVDNCRVYGMALPAIIMAPDLNYWYEVGPSDNVEIRNCHFEKCSHAPRSANLGAVVVKASHDADFSAHPAGVHTNIRLLGNTFKNCGNSGIYVTATKGLEVRDNHFENCSCSRFDEITPGIDCDISVRNSENILVAGNITNKDTNLLVHTDNCSEVTLCQE